VREHPEARPTRSSQVDTKEFTLGVPHAPPPTRKKTDPCDRCGRRFPRRNLIELHEDNHDNLTYFHGDRLCAECTDQAGVIR
jgi:hypothetical protein